MQGKIAHMQKTWEQFHILLCAASNLLSTIYRIGVESIGTLFIVHWRVAERKHTKFVLKFQTSLAKTGSPMLLACSGKNEGIT